MGLLCNCFLKYHEGREKDRFPKKCIYVKRGAFWFLTYLTAIFSGNY